MSRPETPPTPTDDPTRMPYQLPFPAEARQEIVIPHAIPDDDRMWVPQSENVWFRPLGC